MNALRRHAAIVLLASFATVCTAAQPTIRAISADTPPAARAQAPGQLRPYTGTGQQIRAVNASRDQVLTVAPPAPIVQPRVTTPAAANAAETQRQAMLAQLTARMGALQAELEGQPAPPAPPPPPTPASARLLPFPLGQAPALAQSPRTRYNLDKYREQISLAARTHGVDEALVRAVIHAESAYRPRAVSPVGAGGLMQLMPATATRFGVSDRFDPAQNIDGGTQYLAWLLRRYDGDITLATAAYNAGEGAVDRYGGVPPYRETRGYVLRVASLFQGYTLALNGTSTGWDLLPDAYQPGYARGIRMISTSSAP